VILPIAQGNVHSRRFGLVVFVFLLCGSSFAMKNTCLDKKSLERIVFPLGFLWLVCLTILYRPRLGRFATPMS
jgi:hypothetical protein